MTLRDRLQTNNSSEAQLGRKPTFTKEQENDIAHQVLTLAKVFYGLTPTELRRLVFEYAEVNKIKQNFNISCKMAGWGWLQGFLKRNPTVSVKKPEATSLDRISACNVEEVKLFYSNLKSVMDKHAFSSANIYNFDEMGISTVQKPGNILDPKGVKQVGAATSWERGKNITICCAFSAAGTYIPPMFIFPRLRMSPLLKKDGPINAIYECSKNGWINEDLFLVWLDHFIAYAKPTKESPVLLIMDNHTTHTTLAAYNKCKDNNIVVVTIPPHTSHRLQPLDVTFYSSLKAAFARECDSFMKVNAFTKITPYDIASLFNKAYIRVANIEKGVSGFEKTGIFPLDTETFSEEDFTVLNPNASALVSVVDEEPQKNIHEIAVPTVGQVQHEALNHGPKPSTSRQVMDVDETNPNEDLHPPKSDTASLVPFSIISPLPCPNKTSKKPNSRKQHSSILTLTPNKIKLELAALEKEERNKRKENNNLKKASKKVLKPKGKSNYRKSDSKLFKPKHEVTKAKKKLCHRNISFSSSEDEDKCKEIILCDDNEMDDVDLLSFGDSGAISGKELPTEAGCCLLCGEIGRDSELWFRCGFCAGWVHAECSAADSVENFVCDYCKNVS